jgi:uncharacterized integral membrane protein
MVTLRFIIGLLVLVFLVTFALQNMEPSVTFHYYFGYKYGPMPFFFALLSSAVVGIIIAMLFSIFEQFRLRAIIRRQKKQLASLKKEVQEYQELLPEHLIEKNLDPYSGKEKA